MKKLIIVSGALVMLCALLVPVQAFAAKCACQTVCCPIRGATCETECCTLTGWTTCGEYGMPGCGEIPIDDPHRSNQAAFGLFQVEADETPAFLQQESQPQLNLQPTAEEPAEE